MRSQFEQQLMQLNTSLIEMGALVELAISNATHALLTQDISLAKKVQANDEIIDEKEKDIEAQCLMILLTQQPVARDLRLVSTALKMITDMERIGDQAADIAELLPHLFGKPYIKKLEHIPQMATATIQMVTNSIDAYVKKDLKLANAVIQADDVVDHLYALIKKELIDLIHIDIENGEQAFDLIQIAKYYERIGDHATNISEWVIFSITGMHNSI